MQIQMNILSESSIDDAIAEVKAYKARLLDKCELFVKRLAEHGIEVAKENLGSYGDYITFRVDTSKAGTQCQAIMVATNTGIIKSEWRTSDGIKSADVSPLLMVEFGSGRNAQNPMGVPGVGQGTFPDQTHAFDPNGWYYMDLNGEWHHSYGATPKMPIYKATVEMKQRVYEIAREVFGHE